MNTVEVEIEPADAPQQRQAIIIQAGEWGKLIVTNPEEYRAAASILVQAKGRVKAIQDYWKPAKRKADEAHAEICKNEKEMLKPFMDIINSLSVKMGSWMRDEEKRRKDEEARLQAEAQKKAEAEAKRLADALKKSGKKEEAKAVLEEAASAPPPVVLESTVPKVAGLSARKTWKFRVVDQAKVSRGFLRVDEVAIAAVVRSMGKTAAQVVGPGSIEVWEDSSFAGRS